MQCDPAHDPLAGDGDHARLLHPEYERVLAEFGALLPYRRARALLETFFPLGDLCTARSKPAAHHAAKRHLITVESGGAKRCKPAPDHGANRQRITV